MRFTSDDMNVEKEIEIIKKRNAKVEMDKAWELSNTRKIIIGASIYILATLVFIGIRAPDPMINAFIPAVGFLLSTATFPWIKEMWINKRG